jgi:hypothetical protein
VVEGQHDVAPLAQPTLTHARWSGVLAPPHATVVLPPEHAPLPLQCEASVSVELEHETTAEHGVVFDWFAQSPEELQDPVCPQVPFAVQLVTLFLQQVLPMQVPLEH